MKLQLTFRDGETRTEHDVTKFHQSWKGDEWLVGWTKRDGSTGYVTDRDPIASRAEEIDGQTYTAEEPA